MTKTTEGLVRAVAESNPYRYSGGLERICGWCYAQYSTHTDDCWYTWSVEWVKQHGTALEMEGKRQFVDFVNDSSSLEIKMDDEHDTEVLDDTQLKEMPSATHKVNIKVTLADEQDENLTFKRQEWWFGD